MADQEHVLAYRLFRLIQWIGLFFAPGTIDSYFIPDQNPLIETEVQRFNLDVSTSFDLKEFVSIWHSLSADFIHDGKVVIISAGPRDPLLD